MSPNRVVAYNLNRARRRRGWTQDQAAEQLERHLGVRWSKALFSAAERSAAAERVRPFDADELVAMSRSFGLPIAWFFLPPSADAGEHTGHPPLVSALDVGQADEGALLDDAMNAGDLLGLTWNTGLVETLRELNDRVDLLGETGPEAAGARGQVLGHVQNWVRALLSDAMTRTPSYLAELAPVLRQLADQIEVVIGTDEPGQ